MADPLRLVPPGDKSISHRVLMLAPLASGESRLEGLLDARDVRSTAAAMGRLGARIPRDWSDTVVVPGPAELADPDGELDCGNSGTTARVLSGLVVGLGIGAVLDGDASLRSRPMDRVVYPLQALGARIDYLGEKGRLPVAIRARASGSLRGLRHRPRVASAQVKSCLLLAGLTGGVGIEVIEPGRSRDHTERLLRTMGAGISVTTAEEGARVELEARPGDLQLRPLEMRVPGDFSSAAFLIGAALLAGRELHLEQVGLNRTRTGLLDVLRRMEADLAVEETGSAGGEPVGSVRVGPSRLRPFELEPGEVPRTLDEIPLLSVLAARAGGESIILGAAELRLKESDRLSVIAENLTRLGVACREREDGLAIGGTRGPLGGTVRTRGDHRVAMAFGALGADPDAEIRVDDPGCVEVSYPGFWADLEAVTG